MGNLFQDVKYGVRLLLKSPVFTIVAVLTLALGIGANSAIFGLINAVMLRPLPVEDPDRLVEIFTSSSSGATYSRSSYLDYVDLREQKTVFSGVIAYSYMPVNLSGDGDAERVNGAIVSGNYFSVLGVSPIIGRGFLPDEDQNPGAKPVALISYRLWQTRFGGDPAMVGKKILLNGQNFDIVGIAPKGFKGTTLDYTPDLWVPMMMQVQATSSPDRLGRRRSRWLMVIGRLQSGVKGEQAQAVVNTLASQLRQAYPESNENRSMKVEPAREVLIRPGARGKVVNFLGMLMMAAIVILIITCLNMANFMLARASGRWKEIGVRLAMGATRGRIIRQLLTESLFIALVGGGLGLLLAIRSSDIFTALNLEANQNILISEVDLSLDYRVFGLTLLISLLTGLIFGLAPAVRASRGDIISSVKDETPIKGFHKARLGKFLIVSQLAMSLVLLVGAMLFVRSLLNMQAVDPGFKTENALLMSIDVGLQGGDSAKGQAFYQELLRRAATTPGLKSISLAKVVPVSSNRNRQGIELPGREVTAADEYDYNIVSPGYFQTMGISLLQGRDFTAQDSQTAPGVVMINEALAQHLWPGENPLGKRFKLPGSDNREVEVIALVKNSRYLNLFEEPLPYMYLPLLQEYDTAMTLIANTVGDPNQAIPALKREIRDRDANLPVFAVTTLREHIGELLSRDKMAASLVSAFGLLALLLVSLGIYGLMNYTVNERTREIGVRMALGARPRDVFRLIMRQGLTLAGIGILIGLLGAFILTRFLTTQFYEVSPTDPLTLLTTSLIILGVASVATLLPARRATQVEPLIALRASPVKPKA